MEVFREIFGVEEEKMKEITEYVITAIQEDMLHGVDAVETLKTIMKKYGGEEQKFAIFLFAFIVGRMSGKIEVQRALIEVIP